MKIAGIVLLCLQAVSIVGVIASGNLADLTDMITSNPMGILELLGFCLPTIIGVFLLVKAKKKENK